MSTHTYVRRDGGVTTYNYPRRRDTGTSSIRYEFIDGRYRAVQEKLPKNAPRVQCPECYRIIKVVKQSTVPHPRFARHNRGEGGGRGSGLQCPKSGQPIPEGSTPWIKVTKGKNKGLYRGVDHRIWTLAQIIAWEAEGRGAPKPERKPMPKKKPMFRQGVCPECGRTVDVLVVFGSPKLSYANHHRRRGGARCPMALQPVRRK